MISPQYLIDYLRGEATISAAVGTLDAGIPITTEIPQKGKLADAMPRRAIIVTSAGGPAPDGRNNDLTVGRQDVKCYGRTIGDAWALHDIVYENLRYGGQRTMDGKQVITVRPTAGGIQQREREEGWPYVWMEYTLTLSEGR